MESVTSIVLSPEVQEQRAKLRRQRDGLTITQVTRKVRSQRKARERKIAVDLFGVPGRDSLSSLPDDEQRLS